MIWLGCSGWAYTDWNGVFYPRGSSGSLSYYGKFFNSVEVNVTFYRPVAPDTIIRWINTARKMSGFRFSVKVPGAITHELLLHDVKSAVEEMEKFSESTLRPLSEAHLSGALLVQLPPFLRESHAGNLDMLISSVDIHGFRGVLEFRNVSLTASPAIMKISRDAGYAPANIDSPVSKLENFTDYGHGFSYFRFHGRNAASWFTSDPDPSARYRYKYSMDELHDLSGYVKRSMEVGDEVFVYFNNHPAGNAPQNARDFAGIIGIESAGSQTHLF
ncbi:MAG: DUF72 domain-containing protein [Thermoplasmataceae archaeon]